MTDPQIVQEAWNVRKILIGTVTTVTIVAVAYTARGLMFEEKIAKKEPPPYSKDVEGTSTDTDDSEDKKASIDLPNLSADQVKESVENKIKQIQKQVLSLDPSDVASSSPEVQKILKDIKSLEQYPKNQAKEMCENICRGL